MSIIQRILYNLSMGINIDLRTILLNECKTIKALAAMAGKKCGQEIDPDSISQKLNRGTMKYDEAKFYGEVLGYDLQFVKKKE